MNIPRSTAAAAPGSPSSRSCARSWRPPARPSFLLIVSSGDLRRAPGGGSGASSRSSAGCRGWRSGRCALAFSITEPDAGLNTHKLQTTATREGDVYRLRARSTTPRRSTRREAVVVVARTGSPTRRPARELSLFLVDVDAQGFEKQPIAVEMTAPERQYHVVLRRCRGSGVGVDRGRGRGLAAAVLGLEPGADHGGGVRERHRSVRARQGGGYARERVGLGGADRPPPGRGASARQGEDRG